VALRSALFAGGFLWLWTWVALLLRSFDDALMGQDVDDPVDLLFRPHIVKRTVSAYAFSGRRGHRLGPQRPRA